VIGWLLESGPCPQSERRRELMRRTNLRMLRRKMRRGNMPNRPTVL